MKTPAQCFTLLSLWLVLSCAPVSAQIKLYSGAFGAGNAATDGQSLVSGTIGQTLIGRVMAGNSLVGEGFWYLVPLRPIAAAPTAPIVTGAGMALHQNFPNPFSANTSITFDLPSSTNVSLKVFDALGNEVRTLVDGIRPMGRSTVILNAEHLESGQYLARLVANGVSRTIVMVVVR